MPEEKNNEPITVLDQYGVGSWFIWKKLIFYQVAMIYQERTFLWPLIKEKKILIPYDKVEDVDITPTTWFGVEIMKGVKTFKFKTKDGLKLSLDCNYLTHSDHQLNSAKQYIEKAQKILKNKS